MSEKNLKEITYSSEYVAELERKLALAQKESADAEHDKWLLDCTSSYYLEVYKKALKTALEDAFHIVGIKWASLIERYDENALFEECLNKNKVYSDALAEFYFRLAAKSKDKEEWSKRK